MATKSGASHAIAAFVSILLGSFVSNFLSKHASEFTDLSRAIGSAVTELVGISLPAATTGHLLIATELAFVWGGAYHYARHGPDGATE